MRSVRFAEKRKKKREKPITTRSKRHNIIVPNIKLTTNSFTDDRFIVTFGSFAVADDDAAADNSFLFIYFLF